MRFEHIRSLAKIPDNSSKTVLSFLGPTREQVLYSSRLYSTNSFLVHDRKISLQLLWALMHWFDNCNRVWYCNGVLRWILMLTTTYKYTKDFVAKNAIISSASGFIWTSLIISWGNQLMIIFFISKRFAHLQIAVRI